MKEYSLFLIVKKNPFCLVSDCFNQSEKLKNVIIHIRSVEFLLNKSVKLLLTTKYCLNIFVLS